MRILAVLLWSWGLLFCGSAWAALSILQGATSASETWITLVVPAEERLQLSAGVEDDPALQLPMTVDRASYPGSDHVVYRLKVSGLEPRKGYVLDVFGADGQLTDRRKFKALDPLQKDGRVAVGSCMIRQLHNPYLWNNLARPENRPDLLLILGDLVYLDRPTLWRSRPPRNGLEAWQEFVKARNAENLYFWENLVPTLTVWDDHDAGGDNINSNFPLLEEIRSIYNTFTANDPLPQFVESGPGMARRFHIFGKNWILLDSRSFRDASPLNPLFGIEQNRFLLKSLRPGPNFILSGTQFYGAPIRKDSLEFNWPEFAGQWTRELRKEAERKGATLAFVSGDVHFSEVQELEPELFGYWTVEITSSNIHSFGLPGHHYLKPDNPRRRVATGTHNIVLMEFTSEGDGFGFIARAMGWRGNNLFKTVVSIAGPPTEKLTLDPCESLLVPYEIAMD